MRRFARGAAAFVAALTAVSAAAAATEAAKVWRPRELLAAADARVGQQVELEIVEPLSGPSTPELLSAATYGQVRVEIPEGAASELALVPRAFRLEDPDRYRNRFDRVLITPLRVRGELLEDRELRHGQRRSYVVRVESATPLPPAEAIPVGSLAELAADRARFDRKTIAMEGSYEAGFERSALERDIWLAQTVGARVAGVARRDGKPQRVRVVGVLFSAPGAHYGHLGGYAFELQANEIEYLP